MNIFRARYLLPIDGSLIEDGALLAADGRIVATGTYRELAAAHTWSAAVDFGEAVILPPLVNAHTHLELTDFPQWAFQAGESEEPADFVDWVLRLVRVRRTVGDVAVRASLCHGLWESLAFGTGAVGDILTTLAGVGVYAAMPLSGRVFAEVLGVEEPPVADRLAEIAALLGRPPGAALAWGLSPHAPYTLNAATLARAVAFAAEYRLPLAMHWAETAEEIEFVNCGSGPLADRLYAAAGWPVPAKSSARVSPPNPLGEGGLLIHGVHLHAKEVADIARAKQTVALCPRSNSRFGAARVPVAALHRAGVPLALGTDSLASSPSLSVWEELAFARSWFNGALDPQEWLWIATAGGASVLGLGDRMGRLAPGCAASFQVVAVPAGATAATLEEALCAGAGGGKVRAMFLSGENVLPAR